MISSEKNEMILNYKYDDYNSKNNESLIKILAQLKAEQITYRDNWLVSKRCKVSLNGDFE